MSSTTGLDVRRATWIVAGTALALAVAVRVSNAFHYTMIWGFDALYNWHYILRLTKSWELPAPDADWSTAHPPLFYYFGAAICRGIEDASVDAKIIVLRLGISACGLLIAALAVFLVRRCDPERWRRALLAGGLVLFLPVHIYMSSMVNEEIVVAMLISIALVGAAVWLSRGRRELSIGQAAWLGVVAGLAFLTKLTGILVILAVCGAVLLDAWRRRSLREALGGVAVMLLLTAVVGGWFYARNLLEYGYLYPHGLETHKIMFSMPPGDPQILDYLRVPLAIWSDPQVLNPGLLRSVWGSTYLTMWFDGHRVFVPTDTLRVTRVGTAILLLALLPTAAYAVGLLRGVRRVLRSRPGPDAVLLLLVALTLAGYVLFTWQNPWFVTRKAVFLLGLSVPFAYYTSEVLDDWLGRGGWVRIAIWSVLAVLVVLILGTFTFSDLFWNMEHMEKPGVVW